MISDKVTNILSPRIEKAFYHTGLNLGFLFIFSIFINKAPHNTCLSLLLVFGLSFLFSQKQSTIVFLKKHLWLFILLTTFFILNFIINFYHFGFNAELSEALRRARWAPSAAILIPSLSIYLDKFKTYSIPKYFKIYTSSVTLLLFGLILYDSFTRVMFSLPSTSHIFKSSKNLIYGNRASWVYNPIFFSQLMIFASFAFLQISHNFKKQKLYTYVLYSISTACFFVSIFSQTRATWVALIPVLLLASVQFKFIRLLIIPAALISVVFITTMPEHSLSKRVLSINDPNNFSKNFRLNHWKGNLKIIMDHPISGIGFKSNRKPEYVEKYIPKFTKKRHVILGHPHNEYLEIGSGMGISTLLIFLMLMFKPLLTYPSLIKKFKNRPDLISLSSLSAYYIILIAVSSFFDQITFVTWSTLITSWAIIYYLKGLDADA